MQTYHEIWMIYDDMFQNPKPKVFTDMCDIVFRPQFFTLFFFFIPHDWAPKQPWNILGKTWTAALQLWSESSRWKYILYSKNTKGLVHNSQWTSHEVHKQGAFHVNVWSETRPQHIWLY